MGLKLLDSALQRDDLIREVSAGDGVEEIRLMKPEKPAKVTGFCKAKSGGLSEAISPPGSEEVYDGEELPGRDEEDNEKPEPSRFARRCSGVADQPGDGQGVRQEPKHAYGSEYGIQSQ